MAAGIRVSRFCLFSYREELGKIMKYRKYGNVGFDVSALGFGCMRFPMKQEDGVSKIDDSLAIPMLRHAIDNGVNYVDTAYVYGGGQSEITLGKALRDGYREKVKIATKMTPRIVESESDFDMMLEKSLERLGVDYIDFYLFHGMDKSKLQKTKQFKLIEKLDAALGRGLIKYAGFSFHDDYDCFMECMNMYDNWCMVQLLFNYMCKDHQAGERGLKYAADKGLAVVVMEPLYGGKLANLIPQAVEVLDGADKPRTAVQWALDWVWNYPEVSSVLSGMRTMREVEENLAYAGRSEAGSMTDGDLRRIDKVKDIINGSELVPCTACGYCETCPSGVDIPRNFAAYNESGKYGLNTGLELYSHIDAGARADKCVSCGVCEEKCPQKIAIGEEMPKVAKYME